MATPADLARAVLVAVQGLFSGADAALAAQWQDEQRVVVLGELDRVSELVGVYRGRVLAAHRAEGRWARDGDRSFESWRGRVTGQGSGAARSEVELADGLSALPEAAKAVETGEASLGHVRVLTRLRAGASAPVKKALEDGGAAALLAEAAAAGWDAPTFTRRAQAWAASVDTHAVERTFAAVRERRYARVVDRDGGCAVDAFLDPIAGAAFRTALEALSPAPSPGDERTADQRRADALARLGERVLEIGDDRLGAQIRPHLTLLVPADAWTGIQRRKQARANAGTADDADAGPDTTGAQGDVGVAGETGLSSGSEGAVSVVNGTVRREVAPVALAELDDGTVVPPSELERLMCDCEVTRLVLDADGVPLDVGQTQRTYTKELRRAILARDGHCQWPGCTTRASWCEVHHIRWYSHGGPTSLANGLTVCSFHHHQIHRGTATLQTLETGIRFTRRDGQVLGTTNRSAGARRLAGTKRPAAGPRVGEGGGPAGTGRPAGEMLARAERARRPVSAHGSVVVTMRIDIERSLAPAAMGAQGPEVGEIPTRRWSRRGRRTSAGRASTGEFLCRAAPGAGPWAAAGGRWAGRGWSPGHGRFGWSREPGWPPEVARRARSPTTRAETFPSPADDGCQAGGSPPACHASPPDAEPDR